MCIHDETKDSSEDRGSERHARTATLASLAVPVNPLVSDARALRGVKGFFVEEYLRAFRHDHWNIGIVDVPIHRFLGTDVRPDVQWLPPPPPGKYVSDPFGILREGTTAIFFEEFDFRSGKGVISFVREEADGGFSRPRVAIDLPFHASYPFLLEHAESLYCMPETGEASEVALYRAAEFPHRWTKEATLIRGVSALDSTILQRDGRYWLFCTNQDDAQASKLHLWFAPDLFGPWEPHPANPVIDDVRCARPAGTPFVVDGQLYRPGQDSSRTYGGSITVNRVVRLTSTEYREERVATLPPFPGPYANGFHTLSAMGERTLVDGKWFAFNASEMTRSLREFIRTRWPRILGRGPT